MAEEVKRKRGRPRKIPPAEDPLISVDPAENQEQPENDKNPGLESEIIVEPVEEPKKLTKKKQMLKDYYDNIREQAKTHLDVDVDEDNSKFKCIICHKEKNHADYFRSYSWAHAGTILKTGERHLPICKSCAKKIFKFYCEEEEDIKLALNHWCETMDLYYSEDIYQRMIKLREGRKSTEMAQKFDYITDYMTALGTAKMIDKTYWDSPYLQDNIETDIDTTGEVVVLDVEPTAEYPEEFEGWTKEELENYDYVRTIYKYDPFVDEPLADRKRLYYNLASFSDESIADDFAKSNAAIDMCRSMQRLENLNKMRILLENEDEIDVKAIKEITNLQGAERNAINKYSKEYGFNQRYSLNKIQGAGTLTGILKQMDLALFEDALANRYDIATGEGMQQAAEASWKAIFSQLNLSESEFANIVSEQRETITKLRKELKDTKEQLRLANIQIKTTELEQMKDGGY